MGQQSSAPVTLTATVPAASVGSLYYAANGEVVTFAKSASGQTTSSTTDAGFWSGQLSPGDGFGVKQCKGFMVSMYPIDASAMGVFASTGKSPNDFPGISWSVGQEAPVPSSTLPPSTTQKPPSNLTVNGVLYQWQANASSGPNSLTGPNLVAAFATIVGASSFTDNPNAAEPVSSQQEPTWKSVQVLTPLVSCSIALILAAVALAFVLMKKQGATSAVLK